MECTSLSSIFSLFWKNYLSVEFQNCDIDTGVKEKDKEELPFSLLKVLFSAWNLSANPSISGSLVSIILKTSDKRHFRDNLSKGLCLIVSSYYWIYKYFVC